MAPVAGSSAELPYAPVTGAEGGVGAITSKRRASNSFKTMSTGSLVSNSPFTKLLGSVTGSIASSTAASNITSNKSTLLMSTSSPGDRLYPQSRIPTTNRSGSGSNSAERRTSGSRKVSNENDSPREVKDGDANDGSAVTGKETLPALPSSTSPLTPYRQIVTREESSPGKPAPSSKPSVTAPVPFRPNRSPTKSFPMYSTATALASTPPNQILDDRKLSSSVESSFGIIRKNKLVSDFKPQNPEVRQNREGRSTSPDLQKAPYEIMPLSQETAPFKSSSSFSYSIKTGPVVVGLGNRPRTTTDEQQHERQQQQHRRERVIGGASVPPPITPPRSGLSQSPSMTGSPVSALSPSRRGMRGPRALTPSGEDEPELQTSSLQSMQTQKGVLRVLRKKPSNKTVTWAATEEVLEFEVEEEERRRRESGGSNLSSSSAESDEPEGPESEEGYGGRYYAEEQSDDEEISQTHRLHSQQSSSYPYEYEDAANASLAFEEGGSVVFIKQHALADDHDERGSAVSTANSQVEEMMSEIDDFILGDVYSPSQIEDLETMTLSSHANKLEQPAILPERDINCRKSAANQAVEPDHDLEGYSVVSPKLPSNGFSHSAQDNSEDADSVMSVSSYNDEDDDAFANARANLLHRSTVTERSLPAPVPSSVLLAPNFSGILSPDAVTQPFVSQVKPTPDPLGCEYSLPDFSRTSPFLGFAEIEGIHTSSSTAGIDEPSTPKAVSSSSRELPLPPALVSTPTSYAQAMDNSSDTLLKSPLINGGLSPDAGLSRQASIVGSETTNAVDGSEANSSLSWYGSFANGSVGSGDSPSTNRFKLGRDRLDERMKAHQALLSVEAGPTSSSHSIELEGDSNRLPSSSTASKAIPARPALRVQSATLSTSMLPTLSSSKAESQTLVVGSRLTAALADEMESPLDRFQRGVLDDTSHEGLDWLGKDSLSVKHGNQNLLRLNSVTSTESSELGLKDNGRPTRRRSRSTGDADVAETSTPATNSSTVFKVMLDASLPGPGSSAGFADSIESSLDDIYNSRNRSYRIRESKLVVVAHDSLTTTIGGAGDIDPGRAWRKKRPSNVYEVRHSNICNNVPPPPVPKGDGQVFVSLLGARFENLPQALDSTMINVLLDNGRQRVQAGTFPLSQEMTIKKEFEIMNTPGLVFSVDLQLPTRLSISPTITSTSPSSPTKSAHRVIRSVFSSPKKKAALAAAAAAAAAAVPQPALLPDPVMEYAGPDGTVASVQIDFASEASKCRVRSHRVQVPFENFSRGASGKGFKGTLILDLFHLPAIPGISKAAMPKSMDECKAGLVSADWHGRLHHEGVLTQLGGDCQTWRRRLIKLQGNRLVPYSEVTKKAYVEVDLSSATSLVDCNKPSSPDADHPKATDEDENAWEIMENSFKIAFRDGTEISFFADTAEEKQKWMPVLLKFIGFQAPKKSPPDWAVELRRSNQQPLQRHK